jgi:hypothetical protein
MIMVRLEGSGQLKIPMTSSGIVPATFQHDETSVKIKTGVTLVIK